jgi:hypothetical protein
MKPMVFRLGVGPGVREPQTPIGGAGQFLQPHRGTQTRRRLGTGNSIWEPALRVGEKEILEIDAIAPDKQPAGGGMAARLRRATAQAPGIAARTIR